MKADLYHSIPDKKRLESCRRDCATCWDAAQETGAEQFICSREEDNANAATTGDGGYCRMAMVLGDPVGRSRICTISHHRERLCTDSPEIREDYAQPGAVRNEQPSLICDSTRPCIPKACQVDTHTRLVAQAAGCRLLGPGVGVGLPRWGLLGYTSLAEAMKDPSLEVYYQDFTPYPTGAEKAWVLNQQGHFKSGLAEKQYGKFWSNYKTGDPTPREWKPERLFVPRLFVYKGGPGFGSKPGGFDLETDDWAQTLLYNMSKINTWQREHFPHRNGQGIEGQAFRYEPNAYDYQYGF